MKTIEIDKTWDGRRLTRFLQKTLPAAASGQIHRLLRLGRVRVDGRRAREDDVLSAGMQVEIYAEDALFEAPEREDPFYARIRPKLTILHEDEHFLLLDKRAGLICHPDEGEKVHTLLTYAQAYLYQKGAWNPRSDFAPALCNRIDRFTSGVVILAKTPEALAAMNGKIRAHDEVQKYYLCIVHGAVKADEGTLRHYLLKRPEQKKTTVLRRQEPGAKEAVTYYRVIDRQRGLTLCECLLGTGRTHQIRAQFAAVGHPLLGDNQYGSARQNEAAGRPNGQALCAYRLIFDFTDDVPCLRGLNGRAFQVRDVPFVREYFPGVVVPAP